MSQKKKRKKNKPTPFLNHPSHTTQKKFLSKKDLWKIKKSHLPTLKNNQTFPSHATQETNPWVSPHPKNDSPFPTPSKKTPLERGGITPSSPLHPKKPFWKNKSNPNHSSPFLKTPFTICNSFNLIELSTPYTH
jgi:hypothetical protein